VPRVIRPKAIMLGIVGDSASGKSTLTRGLVRLFGEENVSAVCCDDYHRYNRKQRAENGITALNPACNHIDIMEQHFALLRAGQPILKPVYNHTTGDFDPPEYVAPRPLVIAEGLLAFHTRAMRNCFDIKVYLDPPESLRRHWKMMRDTTKRGYAATDVLRVLEHREPDAEAFIRPQRALADIVVRFYPTEGTEETGGGLNARLVLRPTIQHPDFAALIAQAELDGGQGMMRMNLGRHDGKPADILEVAGSIGAENTSRVRRMLRSHLLPDIMSDSVADGVFGSYLEGREMRHSHPLSVTQLVVAYHLVQAWEQLELEERTASTTAPLIPAGRAGVAVSEPADFEPTVAVSW
jgi:phosphoribulokinase